MPLLQPGIIGEVSGIDELGSLGSFVDSVVYHGEGDVIGSRGTLDQALARLYFCADTAEELLDDVERAKSMLRIVDDKGEDMLVPWFSREEAQRCLAR